MQQLGILMLKSVKLMRNEAISDVELQGKGGVSLKKRITTILYRLTTDNYDSGWKVITWKD